MDFLLWLFVIVLFAVVTKLKNKQIASMAKTTREFLKTIETRITKQYYTDFDGNLDGKIYDAERQINMCVSSKNGFFGTIKRLEIYAVTDKNVKRELWSIKRRYWDDRSYDIIDSSGAVLGSMERKKIYDKNGEPFGKLIKNDGVLRLKKAGQETDLAIYSFNEARVWQISILKGNSADDRLAIAAILLYGRGLVPLKDGEIW